MGARLLADENVPGPAVDALRRAGHDVAWMHEDAPGTRDPAVLARAQHESRVLITFDKDFGELAFAPVLRPPLAWSCFELVPSLLTWQHERRRSVLDAVGLGRCLRRRRRRTNQDSRVACFTNRRRS